MRGLIYKVTSPSGKVYIGQTTKTIDERKKWHINKALYKKSKTYNSKFSMAIRKYNNKLIWEILYYDMPIDQLNNIEIKTISEYNSFNKGYNGNIGGLGNRGYVTSEKTKRKLSKINSGKNHPQYGKPKSESTKKKISITKIGSKNPMYGKHLSKKTKLKISNANSGSKNPMYGKYGKNHPAYGTKRTKKQKKQISNANSGAGNGRSKLTWPKVNKIRKLYKTNNYTLKQLATMYNVKPPTICMIVNYKSWKE